MRSDLYYFITHHSIGQRLLVYVLGSALLCLMGVSYLFYNVLQERAEQAIVTNLAVQVKFIEVQFARVEEAMHALASSIAVMKESKTHSIDDYKSLAFTFYLNRPSLIVGTGFGQTPYQIVKEREGFWHYFYMTPDDPEAVGEQLALPHQDTRYADLMVTDNYFKQSYYTLPVNQRKAIWTDPYQWYKITMTSYLVPIFDDKNNLLGVTGADIDVTELTRQVQTPLNWNQGYYAIFTEKGGILSYPPDVNKAINLKKVETVPELAEIWQQVHTYSSGFIRWQGNFLAYQRVPNTKWLLFALVPTSVINQSAVTITFFGILVAGSILTIVILIFINWLNKRLQPILNECNRLIFANQGMQLEFQEVISPISKNMDEIDILSRSFHHMTQQLEKYFSQLETKVKERTQELDDKNQILVTLDQEKNELLGIVAHDLKNPLFGILGLSRAIGEGMDEFSKEEIITFNQEIVQSAEKMFQLIENLLDVSAIESGKINCNMEKIDAGLILQVVYKKYLNSAQAKGIQLQFVPLTESLWIFADRSIIEQIMDNLISNAIKYSPLNQGKTVFLKLYRYDGMIRFAIQDEGPGLSQADQMKLFGKFSRLTPKPTGQEHSTGLGLFIVKKLVTSMSGKVWCESIEGKGAIFIVEFPNAKK